MPYLHLGANPQKHKELLSNIDATILLCQVYG